MPSNLLSLADLPRRITEVPLSRQFGDPSMYCCTLLAAKTDSAGRGDRHDLYHFESILCLLGHSSFCVGYRRTRQHVHYTAQDLDDAATH